MSERLSDHVVEFSRDRIEKGSKSFAVASRLFDPNLRDSAYMLYAWCRHCDDVVDGQELGFSAQPADESKPDVPARVRELRRKTRAAFRGEASEPAFAALASVVERHNLPEQYALALIDGFEMDADRRTYETLEDTLLYCYHVAGVVGVMMAWIMGARDYATLVRACDLGLAFQLTNISRDVRDDWEIGRVYLPADWLREEQLLGRELGAPEHRAAVARVTARLIEEADRYYASAWHGIGELPFRSAWAIAAASMIYRAIGRKVKAKGARAWEERTIVSRRRKIASVAAAAGTAAQALVARRLSAAPARPALWTPPGLIAGQ